MRLCQIYYDASHYRAAIYREIDKAFCADSFFGMPRGEDIRQMNVQGFLGRVTYTPIHKVFGGFFYQSHILPLVWKPYDVYLGLGETHGLSTWLFPILVRLFKPQKRVYFWSHGWYGKESTLKRLVKRIFFALPNGGVFVYGDHARNLMIKEGLPGDKIFVLHNSLAYQEQLSLRQRMIPSSVFVEHFGNSNLVLIMIGRLNANKHIDMLLQAVAKLKKEGVLYNIVLIGDGEERGKLEYLSMALEISEQVWFYGACYDERLNAEHLYNADLCVVPGSIGLTAIHSMMFGTPAITHNNFSLQGPEYEAVKPGVTGDFYEYGSVESLSDTIQKWFINHCNREAVRAACYHEIDTQWNPDYQIKVLKEHLK